MQLVGTEEFSYERTTVWEALHDPEVLKKVIPGCQSMELCDNGEYLITLALGVAAIKGEYEGKARLTDHDFPHHYTLQAEGSGNPGFVKINMDCYLDEKGDDKSSMRWECDVVVGGLIAGIGGRVLSGIAKFMAKNFFKAVKKELKDYNPAKAV
jgi:carbon monoxide dehydrogenase subunit G